MYCKKTALEWQENGVYQMNVKDIDRDINFTAFETKISQERLKQIPHQYGCLKHDTFSKDNILVIPVVKDIVQDEVGTFVEMAITFIDIVDPGTDVIVHFIRHSEGQKNILKFVLEYE
jgi:hypothetical protein